MQWLGRILTAVFVLVVALVVLVFVLENQNSVSLAFLGWPLLTVRFLSSCLWLSSSVGSVGC